MGEKELRIHGRLKSGEDIEVNIVLVWFENEGQ